MSEVLAQILATGDRLPMISTLLFLFALGGAIGSFLNVVVYRLPAGMSLIRPSSRCPKCQTPIRPLDNVPIFGWLKLLGRCRACGARISPRYPIVELTVAILFTVLGWLEPLQGGVNLPAPPPVELPGQKAPFSVAGDEQLWGQYAYHLTLACGLLCIALIESDGQPAPNRMFWLLMLVGLTAPAIWPWLHPVPANTAVPADHPARGLLDGLGGAFVGVVMGCLASPLAKLSPCGSAGPRVAIRALALAGAYLGWQAVAIIAVAATFLDALPVLYRGAWRGLQRIPYSGCLLVGVIAWIPLWRTITRYDNLLGFRGAHWLLAASGLSVLLLALLAWRFRGKVISP